MTMKTLFVFSYRLTIQRTRSYCCASFSSPAMHCFQGIQHKNTATDMAFTFRQMHVEVCAQSLRQDTVEVVNIHATQFNELAVACR